MQLETFRIQNFRSINDSGVIDISRITALLGRNESGKSNLLRALHSLNPAEGFKALNPIKDFPRHRGLGECKDSTPVVQSTWILNQEEQLALTAILPRAAKVTKVSVGRSYGKTRTVGFLSIPDLPFESSDLKSMVRKIVAAVKAVAVGLDDAKKGSLTNAADAFELALTVVSDHKAWAVSAKAGLQALRTAIVNAGVDLQDKYLQIVDDLQDFAIFILGDDDANAKARAWIIEQLPVFLYLDEYPELKGHQDINEYLTRKNNGAAIESDLSFEKLCKVAGLAPQNLQDHLNRGEVEARNQLANRASAMVTSKIKQLWKDRPLKIRFNLDAQHLDTLISDPNTTYDVEVNLDERSRGFQWFFAFYITFSADTNGGEAEDAVLLLDEPGLYLHAKSQSDLMGHFEKDFKNQIIYTTHSPFMVPTHALDSVRTVNIAETVGTTVSNDPTGDSRTLFPLQAALGYNLAQSLFVGPNNLVVEGVTDFWVLSSISTFLAESGRVALNPELTLTPAGGAQKVSYMVALLSSEELNVLVLLDHEKDAKSTKDDLVKSKLIAEQNVIFVEEAFGATPPKEADIEDLLDPVVYEALVRESYAKELKGKTLTLNSKIPRIAKRMEAGLKDLGIEFFKTRPTRLLLKKMAVDPGSIVTKDCANRFESLFTAINSRLDKHLTNRKAT